MLTFFQSEFISDSIYKIIRMLDQVQQEMRSSFPRRFHRLSQIFFFPIILCDNFTSQLEFFSLLSICFSSGSLPFSRRLHRLSQIFFWSSLPRISLIISNFLVFYLFVSHLVVFLFPADCTDYRRFFSGLSLRQFHELARIFQFFIYLSLIWQSSVSH